ncbi:hypothetical protein PT279_08995 [Bifidobacterium sp. ESL0784]|uniref:hypothetical protein n=1 Tax=Bifidobacterium sp. ESL0784 TaxID=2983231 RepID=UPI0023F930F8|nr:hypothetical protein [Bifidobacterium sp. ESL0784]MDF7641718.1 hypothetical protein [Bifidobacterium sp. ESL0784]
MSVICRTPGRGDVLLHRGGTESIGVRWTQDRGDGKGYQPVDLLHWQGVLELRSPSGELWYSQQCRMTADGLAYAVIPASAFAADAWGQRTVGEWRIRAWPTDDTDGAEVLGWGYFALAL